MERTTQIESPERDYENRTQVFRWHGGEFTIGLEGQIVDVATHRTLATSSGAHEWIPRHARKQDVERAMRATQGPDSQPLSRLDDIHLRRNIYR